MSSIFQRLCGTPRGSLAAAGEGSEGPAQPKEGFLGVKGFQFVLNGQTFPFVGANCYYLMTRAADASTRHEVVEALDACAELGLTVVRTWAFNDGGGWNALQTKPNQFDENVFGGLDQVVAWCSERGLKVMLTLTNYWTDYGGMQQYVRWSRRIEGDEEVDSNVFYNDKSCLQMFKQFVHAVLTRTNTITGLAYRDDPTIAAWDIVNEPRSTGSCRRIKPFLQEMGNFIRHLDPYHLITFGAEGFFGPTSKALRKHNPSGDDDTGCDFIAEYSVPCLDFACIHMWQCQWNVKDEMEHARDWLHKHLWECEEALEKPLVIQEFGTQPRGPKRAAFYKQVYESVETSVQMWGAAAGSCFWMLAARTYQDYDGYTVYLPDENGQSDDAETLQVIQQHVQKMKSICNRPAK